MFVIKKNFYLSLRICLRMNVLSPDLDDTEEKVVEKVRTELESKPHSGLEIGHMEEFIVTSKFILKIIIMTLCSMLYPQESMFAEMKFYNCFLLSH